MGTTVGRGGRAHVLPSALLSLLSLLLLLRFLHQAPSPYLGTYPAGQYTADGLVPAASMPLLSSRAPCTDLSTVQYMCTNTTASCSSSN